MFEFIKLMWIMRRVDGTYLTTRVVSGKITQAQCDIILTTDQLPE